MRRVWKLLPDETDEMISIFIVIMSLDRDRQKFIQFQIVTGLTRILLFSRSRDRTDANDATHISKEWGLKNKRQISNAAGGFHSCIFVFFVYAIGSDNASQSDIFRVRVKFEHNHFTGMELQASKFRS